MAGARFEGDSFNIFGINLCESGRNFAGTRAGAVR
jgi:hypothetical protein